MFDKSGLMRVSSGALPPWSSGLGRHPFKVKNAGSNPAGGTVRECLRAPFFRRRTVAGVAMPPQIQSKASETSETPRHVLIRARP